MSSTDLFEIVVEYAEKTSSRHCSPAPSTSSSSASSSASRSGATTPTNKNPRVRRFSKTKKNVMTSLRRSSRKFMTVGKKYARKFSSSTAAKMRLVKYKIDKQYQQKLAESKARLERFNREREELHAGSSQIAILCEEVTTSARSLRETYERQRPVIYHAVISNYLEREVEEAYDDVEARFFGNYYF